MSRKASRTAPVMIEGDDVADNPKIHPGIAELNGYLLEAAQVMEEIADAGQRGDVVSQCTANAHLETVEALLIHAEQLYAATQRAAHSLRSVKSVKED